jgi:hypothetical protein
LGLACDDVTRAFPPTRDRLLKLIWPLMPLSSVTVSAQHVQVQPAQRQHQPATSGKATAANNSAREEQQQRASRERPGADLAAIPPAPGEGVTSLQPTEHGGRNTMEGRCSQDAASGSQISPHSSLPAPSQKHEQRPDTGWGSAPPSQAVHPTGPAMSTSQVLAAAAKAATQLAGEQQQHIRGSDKSRQGSSASRGPAEQQPLTGAGGSSSSQHNADSRKHVGLSAEEEEEVVELEELLGPGRGAAGRAGSQPTPHLQQQQRTPASSGQPQVSRFSLKQGHSPGQWKCGSCHNLM